MYEEEARAAMKTDAKLVDWEEVKRRLAATQRMLADDAAPSETAQARILEQRARELARLPEPEAPGGEREVLEFSMAGESYAFETEWVGEIVVLADLTALPCTPPFVRGVVNIRGRIVSAVDLRRLFGLPDKGMVDYHRIVVLKGGGMEFGVLADRIDGVSRLNVEVLRRETAPGIPGEFALGVMAQNGVLLDARKLLHDRRMVVDLEARP